MKAWMRRTIDRRRPGRRAGWAVALVTLGLSAACTPGILEQGEAGTGKPTRGGEPTTGAANQVPGAATDCPATDELFCAVAPHAFIQTGAHGDEVSPLALGAGAKPTAEVPVTLNGVNLKQGPYRERGRWTDDLVNSELQSMGADGAPAFSLVRVALDWPRFQYRAPDGTIRIDPDGLAALDDLIDVAAKADIHVILDLIHVRTPDGPCTADHRLAGAKWNVPAWAWEEVTGVAQDDDCKARPNELGDLMDEVLVLPETTRFIRTILKRYDASTARGRNVVAVEPVSEAEASGDETGSATSRTQRLIDAVYTRWLASEGQASLRSANSTKILILSPDKGDASLQGVNLAPIALPNVVWSHHDYTLAVIAGSAAGQGYTEDGWASSQMQDRSEVRRPGRPTYDPDLVSFGRRLTERRGYLAQMQHWAAAGGLPIFVGEYGILTTCAPDGNLATAQAYAKASQELYDGALVEGGAAPVSRTWWQLSIGGTFGGEFALLAIDGRTCPGIDDAGWMPAAFDLTAGRIR